MSAPDLVCYRPAHRPESVRLVDLNHPDYREHCRRARLRRSCTRVRDPFAQAYNMELLRWEEIVRVLLSEAVLSASPDRILMSQNRSGLGQRLSFLELDFVAGSPDQPRLFVEIKLRERTAGADVGRVQLRRSLGIARCRWPNLQGLSVCVAMGGLLQTEATCSVPVIPLPQLPEHLEAAATTDNRVIWLDGCEVAERAVNAQLLTRDSIRQLPEIRLDMIHPTRILERRLAEPA